MKSLFDYIQNFVNCKTIVIAGHTSLECRQAFDEKTIKSPKTDIAFSTLKMWVHMATKTIIIIIVNGFILIGEY